MDKLKPQPSDWDVKVKIWERQALNDNIAATQRHFEHNAGEEGYPEYPPDRNTIRKIREELLKLPPELVLKLPPEVKTFVISKRPEMKEKLERLRQDSYQQTGRQLTDANYLRVRTQREHFRLLREVINVLVGEIGAVEIKPNAEDESTEPQYWVAWRSGAIQSMSREQLTLELISAEDRVCLQYRQHDLTCLASHLEEYLPEVGVKGFGGVTRENPYELIQTLFKLSRRNTFNGKCPDCTDLQ